MKSDLEESERIILVGKESVKKSKQKMDLTNIFLFCLISLVIGAVLMILVQYYAFVKYFNVPDGETAEQRTRSLNEKYQLPDVSY